MAHIYSYAGVESTFSDSAAIGSDQRTDDEVLQEAGERRLLCSASLEDFAHGGGVNGEENKACAVVRRIKCGMFAAPDASFVGQPAGADAEERGDGCWQVGPEQRRKEI